MLNLVPKLLLYAIAATAPFDPLAATAFLIGLIVVYAMSPWRPIVGMAATAAWSAYAWRTGHPLGAASAALALGGLTISGVSAVWRELTADWGRIYILRCPAHDENIYKIGYTSRSADLRARELSNTSAPEDFFVVKEYRVRNGEAAEKAVHKELARFRVNQSREYFRAPLKTIKRAINTVR